MVASLSEKITSIQVLLASVISPDKRSFGGIGAALDK
jgi:hypothetical protein